MPANRAPRAILGVDENAGRAEIVIAYRRLAMRWHPDRNPAADAKARFQEIQGAYQTLQAQYAPRNISALWDEMTAAGGKEDKPETDGGWRDLRDDFPFAAAFWVFAGAAAFVLAEYPGDWVLFSLGLLAAGGTYKTGLTKRAWRAEAAFRLALRLYWLTLLAVAVYTLGRKVVAGA